jgi:hypothetical protein
MEGATTRAARTGTAIMMLYATQALGRLEPKSQEPVVQRGFGFERLQEKLASIFSQTLLSVRPRGMI